MSVMNKIYDLKITYYYLRYSDNQNFYTSHVVPTVPPLFYFIQPENADITSESQASFQAL